MRSPLISHVLIMAAGRGNRMRPLTDLIPKPMVLYNGDTLIGNSLQKLKGVVPNIHITVGYKKAMLSEYLMTEGGINSILNTEGYGNAWWIQHTLMRYLNEPVLVLTADNITEIDIGFLSNEYVRLGSPPCMIVPVTPIQGVEGDFVEHKNGYVLSIDRVHKTDNYCSGIQVLNPAMINEVLSEDADVFYLIWDALIKSELLRVSTLYPQRWFSIDTLEQLVGFRQTINYEQER